jgi:hypothetical protein
MDGEAGTAMVTSHAHTPRGAWWELCRICRLSAAAHTASLAGPESGPERYRCPNCVRRSEVPGRRIVRCTHRGKI